MCLGRDGLSDEWPHSGWGRVCLKGTSGRSVRKRVETSLRAPMRRHAFTGNVYIYHRYLHLRFLLLFIIMTIKKV